MDIADFVMTYPCYFLFCEDGGVACIAGVDNDCECVCLFTDIEVLRAFWKYKQRNAGEDSSPVIDPEVAKCCDYNELIEELTYAESELAAEGCHHIAIDPTPKKQVIYISIREFIKTLPAE